MIHYYNGNFESDCFCEIKHMLTKIFFPFRDQNAEKVLNKELALKAEIAKLQSELEKVRGINSECMERNAQLEAELTAAKAEKTELEIKVKEANAEIEKLSTQEATVSDQEIVDVKNTTDDLVEKMSAENAHFRSELDRLSYILHRKDAELDDLHGRLMASRYYINYLQNRPEFQNIRKDEHLPPDMRKKSPAVGDKSKPKKKVHFAHTVDICEYQDEILPGFNGSNLKIETQESVIVTDHCSV